MTTPRLALLVYAAAFGAMLAAAIVLAIATLGSMNSITVLLFSAGLSAVAALGSVAAVVLARR